MAVSIEYEEETSNIDEYLYYAQLISQAFTKALDQQECNVKIVIGLAEEIESQKEKVEDLRDLVENPSGAVGGDPLQSDVDGSQLEGDNLNNLEGNLEGLSSQEIAKKLKDACIDCEFNFPVLNFNSNFDWSFDKLKASLEMYKNIFKRLTDPNLCHVASAFSFSCIPSIIALIMLLVSAYAAILALQKLGGISLSAFIQGIISGLLGQILASLSLRLDTSNTGVGCLIEALREIANDIVSQQDQIAGAVPADVLTELGYQPKDLADDNGYVRLEDESHEELIAELSELQQGDSIENLVNNIDTNPSGRQQATLKKSAAEWTQEAFLETYATMSLDKRSIVDRYMNKVEEEMSTFNKTISSAFQQVSEVIGDVMNNINEELSKMFGLLDYFQCENERSGMDFTAIIEYVDKIMTVVNLLSAILAVIAKKVVKKLCKTKDSVAAIVTAIEEENALDDALLDELDQAAIIEEFLERVVDLTKDENGNLTPLIYDKESAPILPKLSLTSCNLKDFIEAHSLENVIKTVLDDIKEEELNDKQKELDPYKKNPTKPRGVTPPSEYVLDKSTWQVYPIQYEVPKYALTRADDLTTDILTSQADSEKGVSAGIQSILELIYNNPLDSNNKTTDNSNAYTPTEDNNDDSIKNKDYREFIVAPLSVDKNQKRAFENKCKDIADVLETLGNLTKK